MNLYSYTIIDTCSCKKKKKEFCSKKCACVCPDFKSPPCVWSQACAGISARLGTFMLPLTRAVCVCFVQHLTDRRQKCVGPSGKFPFTYSVAVRPDQTPPERRRNPNAVPPTHTAHCTRKIYSMRNMGKKSFV